MIAPGKKHWLWLFASLLSLVVVWALVFRDPVPKLDPSSLQAARGRWAERGPKDYLLAVELSGAQQALYEIRVRDGRVEAMSSDGTAVPERVWSYWNVEGMFRFLDEELASRKHPAGAYGVSDSADVFLHAEFDETLGYPKRFLRQVFGKKNTIEWRARLTGGTATN